MHKKIIGNPVGIPSPHTDFNQSDPKKGDYLKGKEQLLELIEGKVDKNDVISSVDDVDKSKLQIPSVDYVDGQVSGSIFAYHESITSYDINEFTVSDEAIPTTKAVYNFVNNTIADIKTVKCSEKGYSYVYITDHAQEPQDIKITVEMVGSVYGSLYVNADGAPNGGTIAQFDDLEEGINTRTVHIEPGFDEIEFETDPNDCKVTVEYKPISKEVIGKSGVEALIGDIETSIENIIAKYGLGGDAV